MLYSVYLSSTLIAFTYNQYPVLGVVGRSSLQRVSHSSRSTTYWDKDNRCEGLFAIFRSLLMVHVVGDNLLNAHLQSAICTYYGHDCLTVSPTCASHSSFCVCSTAVQLSVYDQDYINNTFKTITKAG